MNIELTPNYSANSFNRVAPYVYALEWQDGSIYIGVRSANSRKPKSDLFKQYFTSSKYVRERLDANDYPTEIVIFDTFDCQEHAHEVETELLTALREFGLWEKTLNRAINGKCFTPALNLTEEERKAYRRAYWKFFRQTEKRKEYMRAYNQTPEVKEYLRNYFKEYAQTPQHKERMREFRRKPEQKERMRNYMRAYKQTDKYKAYMKALRQTPKVKEYNREYMRKYNAQRKLKKLEI